MSKEAIYNQLLVVRCRQGDETAWAELVERWEKSLLYYIRRMIDNEHQAWQILQETWLHVVKGIDTIKQPEYLPKWLYGICRHKIVTYYRQQHKESELQDAVCGVAEAYEPNGDLPFENAEAVHWGLGRINPVFREVLTLYFLQDLSIDEIAEVLSVPAGTVKSRLFHARKQLRKVLEDTHHE